MIVGEKTKEEIINEFGELCKQFTELQGSEVEQKVIKRASEFYKTILNSINDNILVIDVSNFRVVTCNSGFLKNMGLKEEEVIGKPCYEVSHHRAKPCEAPDDLCPLLDTVKTGESSTVEHIHYGKNGEKIYVEISTHPIKNENGKVVQVIHISRDITDRKRVEEELRNALEKLKKGLSSTVQILTLVEETKDPYMAKHQKQVANLARAIAVEMGLPEDQVEGIYMAGIVHDMGKISVPTDFLNKTDQTSYIEMTLIKSHPQIGHDILMTEEFTWPIAQTVLQHHERMDGSGYPSGISGKEMIIEARILAVAEVVETTAFSRSNDGPAFNIKMALEEISKSKGTLYDADVVDACLRLFSEKGFKFDQM